MNKAKSGIWTPWASVMCTECHGPKFPRKTYDVKSEEWHNIITPRDVDENAIVTYCDKCKCDIQVERSVGAEHNLVGKLRGLGYEAHMDQTGGMCSACSIDLKDEGWLLITYDYDGDSLYWVGRYDKDGDWQEEDAPAVGYKTQDEVVSYIDSIKCDIKPSEFKCPYCDAYNLVSEWNRITALRVLNADWNDSIQSVDTPGAHGMWVCPSCSYEYSK